MCEISVVVPTRNRAMYLEKFFSSLARQTLSINKFEIIVIDNGSTDGTKAICQKWSENFKNFKYIFDDNPGLHTGRNIGYQQSVSDLIVFADDDIAAVSTWLESILNGFKKYEDVVLIGGNDIPEFETDPPRWVEELWHDISGNSEKILIDYSCILLGNQEKEINPYYVFGCNFAVRKWILDETQGFHPDGMPDELLCYRGDGESAISQYIIQNKLKARFLPEASVYHNVSSQRMNYKYINKVSYRTGISAAYRMLREGKIIGLQCEIARRNLRLRIGRTYLQNINYMKEKEVIRGMKFLLVKYKKNKDVKDWIHRKNYLEDNGKVPNEKRNC